MAKQCPHCNGFALYDDVQQTCPVCNHVLVAYQRGGAAQPTGGAARPTGGAARPTGDAARPTGGAAQPTGGAARPTGGAARPTGGAVRPTGGTTEAPPPSQDPVFMTELGGRRVQFRGTVREVTHTARLHGKFKKLINCIFQREPYQLGHTSHYTMIRIEEYHPGRYAGRTEDLIFYGDVEGRLYRGDDVTVTAKRVGDRYVVTRLELNEGRGGEVTPTPQLPAAPLILGSLAAIGGLVAFVASGALVGLISAALPTVVTIGLAAYILYKIIRPD